MKKPSQWARETFTADWFKRTVKNTVRNGLIMLGVGFLLTAAWAPVATFLGEGIIGATAVANAESASALAIGLYFGLFGALSGMLSPAINYLFGDRHINNAGEIGHNAQRGIMRAPLLSLSQGAGAMGPAPTLTQPIIDPSAVTSVAVAPASPTPFQDMINAQQQLASASTPGKPSIG